MRKRNLQFLKTMLYKFRTYHLDKMHHTISKTVVDCLPYNLTLGFSIMLVWRTGKCAEVLGYTQLTQCIDKSRFISSLAFRILHFTPNVVFTSMPYSSSFKTYPITKLSDYNSQSYAYAKLWSYNFRSRSPKYCFAIFTTNAVLRY